MADLILHRSEKFIQEDLDYYFSDIRDLHGHVRPETPYSFTPNSEHLNFDFNDGKVGNLFFPFAPFSLDRIYIGISFPLFANNWGASFLRYLLTRIKPGACIVLPVYPEMQAAEKNYWSRSLIENIFLSRSRWLGMSNVWAENDGVMSIRVGRKWPQKVASTAKFLLSQNSHILLRQCLSNNTGEDQLASNFLQLHNRYWQSAAVYAVLEKIHQDHFGMKRALRLGIVGDEGLLAIESLLSSYINIEKVDCFVQSQEVVSNYDDIADHFHDSIKQRLHRHLSIDQALTADDSFHTVCLINQLTQLEPKQFLDLLDKAWAQLQDNGLLLIYDDRFQSLTEEKVNAFKSALSSYGRIRHYSMIAASELIEGEEISHYSSMLEDEIKNEALGKEATFWLVEKAA